MRRALSFFFLLLMATIAQAAVANGRPSKEPVCAHVASIDNWRVKNPRALFVGIRTPDTRGTFIVTFVSECFSRFPNNTLRVEARDACLAAGDSMFFTFPLSESNRPSDTEQRCVVKMVRGTLPPPLEEPTRCVFEPMGPDGGPPLTERCY